MRRFINNSLSYTARRRDDIDLVVVLGYSEKARQIKPSLDFSMPVICPSTPHPISITAPSKLS